uniref:Peptidase S1 domain-containing protein n=1 Tax=Leptobrachium leishanense TaxID=445787 RepID=A0A8C5QQU0_9ANUR
MIYLYCQLFSLFSTEIHSAVIQRLILPFILSPIVSPPAPVCGVPVVSSRIVGGENAQDGEWPWQIVVNYLGDFICGGSLINTQWVLSAAFNVHNLALRIIKHLQYTYTGDRGDITLVKLKNPVTFTDYIQPICLPTVSIAFPSGVRCWVTGWGTRSSGGDVPSVNTLQEVMTPLIDYKQCDQMYHIGSSTSSFTTIIQEEKICSGYKEGGKDSCQGDSGGPLVCKVNGTWIQAGIVSWGEGCASANRPGVYTLVSAYQSWIKTYIPGMAFSNVTIPPPQTTGKCRSLNSM